MRSAGPRLNATRQPGSAKALGAVLVGGASTRFGSDKAAARWNDGTLLDHALRTLRDAGATHLAYVGGRQRHGDSTAHHVADDDAMAPCMLRGVIAALRHAETIRADRALIVACDVPLLTADAAALVLSNLRDPEIDAAVAHAARDHWSCLAVRTRTVARLTEALARDERAVHRAMSHLRVARVGVDERELTNANDVATLRSISDASPPRG